MDMAGSMKKLTSMDFSNTLGLENMGPGVAEEFQINSDPEIFRAKMAKADLAKDPSVGGPLLSLYVNADILGLQYAESSKGSAPALPSPYP